MGTNLFFIPLLFSLLFSSPKETIIEKDFEKHFSAYEVEGSFLLFDLNRNEYISYQKSRCKKGFLPASTFKIPNSLFALEAGILTPEDTIYWNGEESWNPDWNKDHVLKSAFSVSCVPCYQEIARKLGTEKMQHYVEMANYGKMDIQSENIDTFWLMGESRISQFEQIDFLTRLYQNQLPFSEKNMEQLKEVMIMEEKQGATLRAKTGLTRQEGKHIGWFVGYLEKDGQAFFFATNIERPIAKGEANLIPARKAITLTILKEMGLY